MRCLRGLVSILSMLFSVTVLAGDYTPHTCRLETPYSLGDKDLARDRVVLQFATFYEINDQSFDLILDTPFGNYNGELKELPYLAFELSEAPVGIEARFRRMSFSFDVPQFIKFTGDIENNVYGYDRLFRTIFVLRDNPQPGLGSEKSELLVAVKNQKIVSLMLDLPLEKRDGRLKLCLRKAK